MHNDVRHSWRSKTVVRPIRPIQDRRRASGYRENAGPRWRRIGDRRAAKRVEGGGVAARLISAAELRDRETGAHMRRVGRLAVVLARAMGVPNDVVMHLELAAAAHDVGKIGIPDQVLNKPGPLDPEERRIMEQHTLMGARILSGPRGGAVELGRTIALSHHEHWDGSGYPYGTRGTTIPLVARIVAVVDYFDATVTDRPYRSAMKPAAALGMMEAEREKRFDPEVLDRFFELEPDLPL